MANRIEIPVPTERGTVLPGTLFRSRDFDLVMSLPLTGWSWCEKAPRICPTSPFCLPALI